MQALVLKKPENLIRAPGPKGAGLSISDGGVGHKIGVDVDQHTGALGEGGHLMLHEVNGGNTVGKGLATGENHRHLDHFSASRWVQPNPIPRNREMQVVTLKKPENSIRRPGPKPLVRGTLASRTRRTHHHWSHSSARIRGNQSSEGAHTH